ncbi:hypothetical protein WOLCODRAFT_137425 [Wolfiporia cocos MD-104 SS10]|uniref:RING-type domain-containing protein n=1 Tax=Wolfiporia cocos (strain MD-104) TaxID=742152 RepID=A0A2H3JIY2_WOLCO|nr:hypothetical protein WOLCODRAFT_137425 [Wolfiporia cocos MD-104 SS10]
MSRVHPIEEIFLSTHERMALAISELPTLAKESIPLGDSCPICLNTFESIYEGHVQNEGLSAEIAAEPVALMGVTKLEGCGHIFCRVDMVEWIRGRHGTCPTCRHQFANIRPITESDYESSDGDYVPGEDDEDDEDDGFLDADDFDGDMEIDDDGGFWVDDGFDTDEYDLGSDSFPPEQMEELATAVVSGALDAAGEHGDSMENLGLSDGDGSESFSDGDILLDEGGEIEAQDNAGVFVAEDCLTRDHRNTTAGRK